MFVFNIKTFISKLSFIFGVNQFILYTQIDSLSIIEILKPFSYDRRKEFKLSMKRLKGRKHVEAY